MWLVSELADKGTLADAMKSGLFKQTEAPGRNLVSPWERPPTCSAGDAVHSTANDACESSPGIRGTNHARSCVQPFILLCLLDAARGLEYLHSCNIMHGDLKPQNVLLKTAGNDRRGFVCKLGDFGLSRMLPETQTHVNTGSYGTVTHASPELLTDGRLTKASDVFAFGILLWELVTGLRLFPDMHHMQVRNRHGGWGSCRLPALILARGSVQCVHTARARPTFGRNARSYAVSCCILRVLTAALPSCLVPAADHRPGDAEGLPPAHPCRLPATAGRPCAAVLGRGPPRQVCSPHRPSVFSGPTELCPWCLECCTCC